MMRPNGFRALTLLVLGGLTLVLLTGCPGNAGPRGNGTASDEELEIQANRAKLSPEDRQLVDAQNYCVVSDESRLGSMGTPVKVMIKGQPVFLCCAGCKEDAEADPDKTLAKVEELKNNKASREAPK